MFKSILFFVIKTTDLVIIFYNDIDGKKSIRTIKNIKSEVTNDDLDEAANAISQLIYHVRYEARLVIS